MDSGWGLLLQRYGRSSTANHVATRAVITPGLGSEHAGEPYHRRVELCRSRAVAASDEEESIPRATPRRRLEDRRHKTTGLAFLRHVDDSGVPSMSMIRRVVRGPGPTWPYSYLPRVVSESVQRLGYPGAVMPADRPFPEVLVRARINDTLRETVEVGSPRHPARRRRPVSINIQGFRAAR